MAFIPLIWFLGLFIFIYKKRRLDASAYVTLMYVITSIVAVLLEARGLIEPSRKNISFFSAMLYCVLLTLTIIPVYNYNSRTIRNIQLNETFVNIVTCLYFFCFVFTIAGYYDDIIFKLTFADFSTMRGNELYVTERTFSGLLRIPMLINNLVAKSSILMFPIFFLCLTSLKKPWWFLLMAFLGTTTTILWGIIGVDRSKTFYWLIVLGYNLVFFWHAIADKIRRVLIPLIFVFGVGAFGYLAAVTASRFGDSNEGTATSVYIYGGQSFSNFCYFIENYKAPDGFKTNYLLPFTHSFIIRDYEGAVTRQYEIESKTGEFVGLFYTFLGSFYIDGGWGEMTLFLIIYFLLWKIVLTRKRRFGYRQQDFMLAYALAVIPCTGCILYIYTNSTYTFSIVVIFILASLLPPKTINYARK